MDRMTFWRGMLSHSVLLLCLLCGSRLSGQEAGSLFPPQLVQFHPYAENPVFQGAGPGHWDAVIRERGWILKEPLSWKMWYTGYDGNRASPKYLGYATSPDGIQWSRSRSKPIYDAGWVEDMQVLRTSDGYLMVAEGTQDQAQLLISRDGIHWTREGPLDVRYVNGQPLSTGPYGTPTLYFENGVWNLFYERQDLGVWLARSSDRKLWINVQDEPVLTPGPEDYDNQRVALNQIVPFGGRYYAYYHGAGSADPQLWSTCVAVSDDLIHWTKYPGNPLLPRDENKSSGIVVYDGRNYRLYTMHRQVDVYFSDPARHPVGTNPTTSSEGKGSAPALP